MRVHVSLTSLALLVLAGSLSAQDSTNVTAAGPAAADSVHAQPKKKKGFFGKVKDAAMNKTVQQVAKVAACTMIPGGTMVAGAIDAASSASDGNASGAASGAAGAATGSSCMGAPGGGAGMPGVSGAAGMAAMAGTAAEMMAGNSRFGGAEPGAVPGPGTEGSEFVMTEKQEKQYIKMMKKAGLSEEQAVAQLAQYKHAMASGTANDEN